MAFHPSLTGAGEWPYVFDVMAWSASLLYVNVRRRIPTVNFCYGVCMKNTQLYLTSQQVSDNIGSDIGRKCGAGKRSATVVSTPSFDIIRLGVLFAHWSTTIHNKH